METWRSRGVYWKKVTYKTYLCTTSHRKQDTALGLYSRLARLLFIYTVLKANLWLGIQKNFIVGFREFRCKELTRPPRK